MSAAERRPGVEELLQGSAYAAYLYSYPHKTAYRPLRPPVPLVDLWRTERREALSLYIHVPFCSTRCGYCNLFSLAHPPAELLVSYLAALERQAAAVREAIAPARFARFTIGGGTPTLLAPSQLEGLLDLAERGLGVDLQAIPACVEVSPVSAEAGKLRMLRARGIDRISIGVQSFAEEELHTLGRQQGLAAARSAVETIRGLGFPTLNIDLIYGIPSQTAASFEQSLRAALGFHPEELYLYPLYVRQLTAMARRPPESPRVWDEQRTRLYRLGRELLLGEGYRQLSMRMFRSERAPVPEAPAYRCQEDGMIGIGCGARSYTESLHYSLEYAVRSGEVRSILAGFAARSRTDFALAEYGVRLDDEDRRRRYLILSLLSAVGLDLEAYRQRFGGEAEDHLPELRELESHGLLCREGSQLRLTSSGLERSDAIGPWLRSARVERLMAEYRPR